MLTLTKYSKIAMEDIKVSQIVQQSIDFKLTSKQDEKLVKHVRDIEKLDLTETQQICTYFWLF